MQHILARRLFLFEEVCHFEKRAQCAVDGLAVLDEEWCSVHVCHFFGHLNDLILKLIELLRDISHKLLSHLIHFHASLLNYFSIINLVHLLIQPQMLISVNSIQEWK